MALRAYLIKKIEYEKKPFFTSHDNIFDFFCDTGCLYDDNDFVVVHDCDVDAALEHPEKFDKDEIRILKKMKKMIEKEGGAITFILI